MNTHTDSQERFDRMYREMRRLWLVMLISVAMNVILIVFVNAFIESPFDGFLELPPGQEILILGVFASVSLGMLPFVYVMRRSRLDKETSFLVMRGTDLVTYACSELPAVCGTAFYLISGRWWGFLSLFGLSLFLMGIFYPRRRAWEGRASRIDRASNDSFSRGF